MRDTKVAGRATRRLVICGAGGRDFHDFNLLYRDDPGVRVVAFTATRIPGIDPRRCPPELSGANHPDGISIVPEAELEALCREEAVDEVVLGYSDLSNDPVMALAARVQAASGDPAPSHALWSAGGAAGSAVRQHRGH